MPSKVYYIGMEAPEFEDGFQNKIVRLFEAAGLGDAISKKDLTAIKTHFGEKGNTTFISPWLLSPIVDEIKKKGGNPFITDTNTLYSYARKNAVDHLKTASSHGYTEVVVGAPIIIADGLTGRNEREFTINKKHFDKVKLAGDIVQADSMIVASHFKGHQMAGFGGAIKNLAMGCATVAGKKDQHNTRPFADEEKCTGCGTCANVCPVSTIEIVDGKAKVNSDNCIGCNECVTHCPEKAMMVDWDEDLPEFMERMTEYAYGAYKQKKGKIGFINFAINITPECDCFGWSQRVIVRDIGILASKDPVALDKACYDLVNQAQGNTESLLKCNHEPGADKFKGLAENTIGERQLSYGEEIGLGSQEYELIKL